MITIYHNGECSKSRGALEILQEQQIPHEVRWYITEPLSETELQSLLKKLGTNAASIARRNEAYFENYLVGKELNEEEWLQELLKHPELVERPIVVNGEKAIIARPPERLFDIL